MLSIKLPQTDGSIVDFQLPDLKPVQPRNISHNRIALSAVHVVADPFGNDPIAAPKIDWEKTIAYRDYLWSLNLGVAEAMDTAQRGMGLSFENAKELIKRSIQASKAHENALLFSGCGTDHLQASDAKNLDDVIAAYEEQIEYVEGMGGEVILMASRALAAIARSPDDYARVYDRILGQVQSPVIIHWLGDMFDPALAGYWGHSDLDQAMDVALQIVGNNASKVNGIKISLLDKDKEINMRNRLPEGVKMYTGDDFNFAELIQGDADNYSHALLGIFDAIAPAASSALEYLAEGNTEEYNRILEPTVPLSRLIFSSPTKFYKTGVVFLAWLNGHQDHFTMLDGQQSCRSITHLSKVFELAAKAAVLTKPELAVQRMQSLCKLHRVS
ncbi:dihydrodipicolinate synthase family protein [Crocinitomix catalasitica]|nr:dihydrodipicolinate synthase family protein [Crocinitomix catalasitica]